MKLIRKFINYLARPKNMTEGKPSLRLIEFAVPLLIGNFVQQLYNTVDSIIVGKYIGDQALAAIGATTPLIFFLITVFIGISVGAGILVSQYFGAKNKEMLSKTIGNTMLLNFVFSIILALGGLFLTGYILDFVETPPDIREMAYSYLLIMCVGIIGMSYYNILTGLLRGLGDSISPLLYLIVSSILNIVLDLLFVTQFHMGVAGAAIATVISQTFSAILCYLRIYKMRDIVEMKKEAFLPDFHLIGHLLKLGLPVGVSQGMVSITAILVQRLVNSFGTTFIAVSTVVMRVDGFIMLPNFSFGNALSTFTGQNAGAMKLERIKKGIKDGLRIGMSTSAVLVAIILVFGKNIMALFTDTEEVINYAYEMMLILGISYIAFSVIQILQGAMRGAGDTKTPMFIAMFVTFGIRLPASYLFAFLTRSEEMPAGNPRSVFFALAFAWFMSSLITTTFYKRGKWAKRARIGGEIVDISEIFRK